MITTAWVRKHACSERKNELYLENAKTDVFSTQMVFKADENKANWFLFYIVKIFESQHEDNEITSFSHKYSNFTDFPLKNFTSTLDQEHNEFCMVH